MREPEPTAAHQPIVPLCQRCATNAKGFDVRVGTTGRYVATHYPVRAGRYCHECAGVIADDRNAQRRTRRAWTGVSGSADLANRTITHTIPVGDTNSPAGTIDVRLIPGDEQLRAFTAGMADNQLYLVDTQHGTATAVFDFGIYTIPLVPSASVWPQLLRINKAGTRLFITLNYAGQAGKVVMLDITDPVHPVALDVADPSLRLLDTQIYK